MTRHEVHSMKTHTPQSAGL